VWQVKIWFQNRRSKYKKLLKQFGLSAGRVPSAAVMESTVTSDLPECAAAAAVDIARIKSSPQSFDDSPDASDSTAAAAATSTTTDDMTSIELGVSCGSATLLRPPRVGLTSTCWSPPPAPASIDNSQQYLAAAAAYDLTAATYSSQHEFVSVARTTCYQPWCLSAEHCHHNLFT